MISKTTTTLAAFAMALGAVGAMQSCADGTDASSSAISSHSRQGRNAYEVERLVSDDTSVVPAEHQDPLLKNAWGLAASATGPWWVANAETSSSTVYNGEGEATGLQVTVPGSPTGLVFHSGTNFVVTDGTNRAPAAFIFATETGTIVGWAGGVPPTTPPPSRTAHVMATTEGAIYKGLAIATTTAGERLFATDFHHARIDVFDDTWNLVTLPSGAFTDPDIPAGFSPFGIRSLNGMLIVTYAKQDADAEDDVAGPGLGYVDAFNYDGTFRMRIASRARLNAPWGIAMAPAEFGAFGGALLIGNFGNGHINAFDLTNCHRNGCHDRGELHGESGGAIAIDGLWALDFGHGNANTGDEDALYFTSGPDDEEHGLFGYLEPAE